MTEGSAALREAAAEKFRIEYPGDLPITAKISEIEEAWRSAPLIIVGGETGSGKTTQLPKVALQMGCGRRGMIGCTQPRRIAAAAMARRLAQELHCTCGKEVGSQVRFDDRTSAETVLKFMTDGILLAELRRDPLFRRYDCLIIDEAHERTLNIDFLLGLLRETVRRRRDLKVAVSSATLDVERFREFFGGAPVVEVEGRGFPVEDIWLPPREDEELAAHVARAVEELDGFDRRGDILVFLPGEREIRECAEMLSGRRLPSTEILQLYSRLGTAEQQRVFHPGNLRRIILSTNVAETSLTIPRIRFCIDSGLARISRYNPRRRIQELQIEMISRASVRQRRGRCGRTADGICVHLYGEEDLQHADAYTDPEIKRTSLAGVMLQMAYLGLPDIRTFPFIDPPAGQLIREGFRTLCDIRAVNDAGRITADGRLLARLPIDPHLGRMLLAAKERKVLPEMIALCAGLAVPDPRERPAENPQAADQAHARWKSDESDFIGILNCRNDIIAAGATASNGALRRFCKRNFLNFTRTREWFNLAADLAESLGYREKIGATEATDYAMLHEALLCGIPRNIARWEEESRMYRGIDGKKFVIFPGSGLARRKKPPEWLVCFALVETSRLFGRNAAAVDPQWLIRGAPHLCARSYDQEHFERSSGFVRARERISLGGLLLSAARTVDFSSHNPEAAREIFIREGILPGLVTGCAGIERFNAMRKKLLENEIRMRRLGFLYDEAAAETFFRRLLPPEVSSAVALRRALPADPDAWHLDEADFTTAESGFDPEDYPDELEFGKIAFRLTYRFDPGAEDDGATLLVPEDQLNLLPLHVLDYPVPGLLPDLAETMLRALPRELRRRLPDGIVKCAEKIAAELKRDPALRETPPAELFANRLGEWLETRVDPRLFARVEPPEYLRLKLGILDAAGKLREVRRDLPDRARTGSRVSASLPGAARHQERDWQQWRAESGVIPESLELPPGSGRTFYPALAVDEHTGTVNKEIFTKAPEARRRHRAAVAELFLKGNARLLKMIRGGLRFGNEVKLSLALHVPENVFAGELLRAAVRRAAGCDLAQIRSAADFEAVSETIRMNLSGTTDRLCADLEFFAGEYSAIAASARRAGAAGEEIRAHLDLLFAPGFLKRDAVFDHYRRYLRALSIRAKRAADAPGRDLAKGEAVARWVERFDAALRTLDDLTDSDGLCEFWELLEECRIAVYAPEVKCAVRAPLSKIAEAWDKLRI